MPNPGDDLAVDGVFRPLAPSELAAAAAAVAPRGLRVAAGDAVAWAALVAQGGGVWQAVFASREAALDALAAAGVSGAPADE
jgi:hypothetical protein